MTQENGKAGQNSVADNDRTRISSKQVVDGDLPDEEPKTIAQAADAVSNISHSPIPERRRANQRKTDPNYHALTRINQVFQSQHSEHGFMRAQNDVNETLAEKEILLNNRFVLVSVIGAGGMGTVYKARDIRKVEAQDANPYVAVKVLNSDFRNHPDAFISLQREASRSHLLSHPNIVTVHDFDRDGNTIYMTMELLEGEALDDFLHRHQKTGGVQPEEAFEIITQLCDALAFAHQKGIIHSDLKPANIFISEQGVKILDFGIARLAASSKYQDKFDAGAIGAITPAYASLEMLEKKPPDASDDVFAAAIITYELLTGRHPYSGKSAATALALNLEPIRIDNLSTRQWKALSKALVLRREQRTASIKEFHQDLTEAFHFPVYRVMSLSLLFVVGWFTYSLFWVPDELTRFVDETLIKAQECYQQEDYFCAISSVNAILKIEPQHQDAIRLLESAERDHQRQMAAEAIEADNLVAQNCFAERDYQCVLDKTQKVLLEDPQNVTASNLFRQASQAVEQQRQLLVQQNESFNQQLSLATDCFKKKNYTCAIEYAEAAQQIKPNHVDADTIIRNATYAQQQERDNLQKANKILQDGEECLKKLNYSCAIAKSESALEFVPGHGKALAMKKEAEIAIANLKKAIQIE